MDTVKKLHQNNNPFLLRNYNGRIKTCRGCKMTFKTPVAPKLVIAHRERYVYRRTKRSKRLLMTERDFFTTATWNVYNLDSPVSAVKLLKTVIDTIQ